MTAACGRCGVRADVGCKHQPAAGSAPPAITDGSLKADNRRRPPIRMGGMAFHPGRRTTDAVQAAAERLFTKP